MQINLTGQTLGSYELREVIGIGGMGVVYSAYQATLKREVAVKVLLVDLSLDTENAERFDREAEISAKLEHPHIVPIIDHGTYQTVTYVVMRLLTGGTLAQRIQKRIQTNTPLPSFGEIVKMLNQLAGALDYAHSFNVIHRDIKPNNIMFDQVGNAYLVDFGIAKMHGITNSGITGTGMVIGTFPYMPPEQWRGDFISPATDQYALGIITYSLITGHLPFNADTPYQFMHKHLHEEPLSPRSFRTDLSSELEQVLKKVLAKEPQDRFSNVTAFAEAFENGVGKDKGANTDYFTFRLPRPTVPPANIHLTATPEGSKPPSVSEPAVLLPPPKRKLPIWLSGIIGGVILALLVFALMQGDLLAANNAKTPTLAPSQAQVAQATFTNTPTSTDTPTDTSTPTKIPDTPNSDELLLTVTARRVIELTATATLWTHTPTPTQTDTPTLVSTTIVAANPTRASTATLTPEEIAQRGVTSNTQWTPYSSQDAKGVNMVLVPAGTFTMGSPAGQGERDENPMADITIVAFWLDETEVSQSQYAACVTANICRQIMVTSAANPYTYPMTQLTWFDAQKYCEWRGGRLPTEAEWEYAARGVDNLIYPWGNDYQKDNIVWSPLTNVNTISAGVSWVGVSDIIGNVREWTGSSYEGYSYNEANTQADPDNITDQRALRGGSFNTLPNDHTTRAAFRNYQIPDYVSALVGVRCARDLN